MIEIADLPAVNAALNATSGVLVLVGYGFIRRQRKTAHAICMACAVAVAILFFISYITYHAHVGSKHFDGQGVVRPVYFMILISHTILAATIAFWLVPVTVYRAARRRFDRHKADKGYRRSRMVSALTENLARYEQRFGAVTTSEAPPDPKFQN